jgi:hypothetical protein
LIESARRCGKTLRIAGRRREMTTARQKVRSCTKRVRERWRDFAPSFCIAFERFIYTPDVWSESL